MPSVCEEGKERQSQKEQSGSERHKRRERIPRKQEFENALRETLKMDEKTSINMAKLKIRFDIRIYTNLGAYVVGTRADVAGDDSRLGGNGVFRSCHGFRIHPETDFTLVTGGAM